MEAISSTQALAGRRKLVNPNSGAQRWRTPFMGVPIRVEEEVRDGPLAFLIEMTPDSVLPTHFHPVDQYQVFVSGSGLLGKHGAHGLAIHYADHHTAYGPITAGPHGVAYFTFRAKTDGRGMFLHKPGAREQLKPSPRRFRMVDGIVQAVPPVLAELPAPVTEQLLKEESDDGLASFMLRMGAGAGMRGPDPAGSSGQYYLVVSGSLLHAGAELPVWSVLWVGPAESAPSLTAGAAGAELLVLQFPGTRQTAPPLAAGELRKWQCALCGFVYDEARGLPDEGIAPGTRWEDVPADWTCPDCSATKSDFEMIPMD